MTTSKRESVRKAVRIPISGGKGPLKVDFSESFGKQYRLYWAEEEDLEDFLAAGYEFVEKTEIDGFSDTYIGSNEGVDSRVTRRNNPKTKPESMGYLMKQKKEWYEEDKKLKNEIPDKREEAMKKQANAPGKYGKVDIYRGKFDQTR